MDPATTIINGATPAKTGLLSKGKYVDLSYLINQTKGNTVLVKKMITLYLKQTPELLITILDGTEAHDWVTVNTAVHKMIPSFWMMGIDPAMELMAREIQENTTRKINLDTLPALCKKFEEGCLLACNELEELVKNDA